MKMCSFFLVLMTLTGWQVSNAATDDSLPHLETRHGVRQLVVDGQPFLILGGELHNSSSSSRDYMKAIWPDLVKKNLNTVLASVTWEMIEPEEGKFDFSSVDGLIQDARQYHLRLVFLWFGSWKNGESSYAPFWVKTDPARFPLVKDGKDHTLNILSTFGAATCAADAQAFAALMRHIRETDGVVHTVLMMQVENETGILGDSRDRSAMANGAFDQPVPVELMTCLQQNKETLAPELLGLWKANGFKTSGTWTDIFGPGKPPSLDLWAKPLSADEKQKLWRQLTWPVDEIFMAWNYSRYVNQVAAAGKAEYPIPMYCNAWLQQSEMPVPGKYPSGGPVPQVQDVWRCGAPAIDFFSPDLYVPEFAEECEWFTRNENPLFIPEANTGGGSPENALQAFLKFNAIGFSPFGIDPWFRQKLPPPAQGQNASATAPMADPLAETYAVLDYLAPVILDNQGKGTFVFLAPADGPNSPPQKVKLGDYTATISFGLDDLHKFSRFFTLPPPVTNSFPDRLVICSGPGEFIFVGGGMRISFISNLPGAPAVRLASCQESLLVDGHWVPGRYLNGDESGNNSRWPFMRDFGIYRIKVY